MARAGWAGSGVAAANRRELSYARRTHKNAAAGTRNPLDEGVTVVINTYKRPDALQRAVEHYSSCPIVDALRVVWTEDGSPPNMDDWDIGLIDRRRSPRVRFDPLPNSLNSRFRPLPDLHTHAIFSVDDDIEVKCRDLKFAFEVWCNAQRALVGFYPRIHTPSAVGWGFEYHTWWYVWWRGRYSLILTKAALLHRHYLRLYSTEMPRTVNPSPS